LFRIASNNGIDFLRKRRANTVPLENPDTDRKDSEYNSNFKSETLSPEEKYIRQQRANILRRMVSRLKPRYRMLVELRYFKEYSYDEIAKELNLPLGTVKVQLFRAREMLVNLLKKTEMGSDEKGK
jgi:RNA polymerase sigma-70 factor (ECF subfamily)